MKPSSAVAGVAHLVGTCSAQDAARVLMRTAMKKKLQVFVSSTYTDMVSERQAAVQAILKAGHIPAGMELFKASDKSQWDTITRWIDESDVYMLILGGRYGTVDVSTGVSYTEMEYDYAVQQGKSLFAVVINDEALERKVRDRGTSVMEKDNQSALKLFREKVLKNISSFFDDERDIRLAVYETLGELRDNPDLKGWISGSEIEDTQSLHDQISALKEENQKLSSAQAKITPSTKKSESDVNFDELIKILENVLIAIPEDLVGKKDQKAPLLRLMEVYADYLINGVTSTASDGMSRFLYHNVCPKLAVHNLIENEKVAGAMYRRSSMTALGKALLADIARREHAGK